jgi:hypothetical protein
LEPKERFRGWTRFGGIGEWGHKSTNYNIVQGLFYLGGDGFTVLRKIPKFTIVQLTF